MCERRVVVVTVVVELGEHEIPELHVAVAVAARLTVWLAAAVFRAAVKMDLRAGAARTGAVLPEVVFLAETNDFGRIDTDLLRPDIKRLVVILIDCDPELILRQFENLCDEFPRPGGNLALEIIAEGEVAEHLKIGAVARRDADTLDIRRADALLACCHAFSRRRNLAGKVLLHRSHTGVDQKEAVVVLRDQREARQTKMSLGLKEREIFFSELIQTCPLHCISPFL